MWIKICGMTTAQAVDAALSAGVDAIGFVFAQSPRCLSLATAVELAAPARGRALCVAVSRHPAQADIDEILAIFKPDILQTDCGDFESLQLPAGLVRLPVVRSGSATPQRLPARLLFEGPASGTGATCDWLAARTLARRTEVVLAGGLSAANVGDAIASVAPFGVDVSSGVEESPGVKSPQQIYRFAAAARAGFAKLATGTCTTMEESPR